MNAATRPPSLARALFLSLLASLALAAPAGRAAPADYGLTVPAGFEVQLVAGPPLVSRPIVADFDDAGRLYVADSSGSNDKVEKQLEDRPHRIVRLEDRNRDGVFDTSTVFADKMMFPEGTMWFDGSLYVAAPPSIWKLTDTNGDGVADQREEWFQGKTLTGCANDLHGPYLGPDGWIYWTKGAFAQQTYERAGKAPFTTRASHIFRRRPGEAAIESVMTGGMDNPVDVAFTATGERILTATFLEHPQLGRRDAVLHAVYGGVYGKPHAVLDGHARTGDLMPVMLQLGPAVPAGLTRYASAGFGAGYRENFFAAMFNLHKVTRLELEPAGATFTSRETDFVVSQNPDFHPTDVLEDADGSLLVVDTGPWYKLCCPTSQLAKPDLPGAIYRIRRTGAARVNDPRGAALGWDTMQPAALGRLLDDRRPAVQSRVLHAFGKAGGFGIPVLSQTLGSSPSAEARRNALWALARIDAAAARAAVRVALGDRDPSVRQTAVYVAGLWRDPEAVPQLLEALKTNAPALQRAAAEALGRTGDPGAVPALLASAAAAVDRVLEHTLTYALIEIGDPAAVAGAGLQASSSRSRRVALIALDQMAGGHLKAEALLPLLESADPLLRDTAWWIAARHPEWGGMLVAFFAERLKAPRDAEGLVLSDLEQKLGQFGENAAVQTLLAAAAGADAAKPSRHVALRAMAAAGARLKMLPPAWTAPLVGAVSGSDRELVREAIAVVRSAPAAKEALAELNTALRLAAADRSRPADLRLDALAAVQGGAAGLEPEAFELAASHLSAAQPVAVRASAARALENAALTREQLFALTRVLKSAGPLELSRVLRPFEQVGDEALGLELIAALEASPARSSVMPDALRSRLVKYPEPVQRRAEALLASIHADTAAQSRALEQLLPTLQGGDIRRGQLVFNGEKAACMSCHAIGYMGGKAGPDLTRIGQVRSERDLLEAIVYPSASFVRSYEPIVVTTKSGGLFSGVVRGDLAGEVVLATGAREDLRIPRTDIKDMRPGTVSMMPPGYREQLTRQELADLIAFLKATRSGAS